MGTFLVASRLRALLERGLSQVEVVSSTGEPSSDGYSMFSPYPRLTLCCSGTRHYGFHKGAESVEVVHREREGIYTAPECWFHIRPRAPYEALSAIFYEDATVFTLALFNGSPEAKQDFPHRTIVTHVTLSSFLDGEGRQMCRALLRPTSLPSVQARCLSELLWCKALEMLEAPGARPSKAEASWQAARYFIEENCHRPISRDTVALALRVHPNHVSRLFSQRGETFAVYLLRARLERAQRLLKNPTLNVSEVAALSGFVNANYFIRTFKARYNSTPGRARGSLSRSSLPSTSP